MLAPSFISNLTVAAATPSLLSSRNRRGDFIDGAEKREGIQQEMMHFSWLTHKATLLVTEHQHEQPLCPKRRSLLSEQAPAAFVQPGL